MITDQKKLMQGLHGFLLKDHKSDKNFSYECLLSALLGKAAKDANKAEDPEQTQKLIQSRLAENFHATLFRRINEKDLTDVEVYKKAHVDRKLFSKIRSNANYHPRKATVIALALALNLNLIDTIDLLSRAEYAFSPASLKDLIVVYFISSDIYDLETINFALYEYTGTVLGE